MERSTLKMALFVPTGGGLNHEVSACPLSTEGGLPSVHAILYQIMGDNGDVEANERAQRLVAYLQKILGYALTADVSEKVFFASWIGITGRLHYLK